MTNGVKAVFFRKYIVEMYAITSSYSVDIFEMTRNRKVKMDCRSAGALPLHRRLCDFPANHRYDHRQQQQTWRPRSLM